MLMVMAQSICRKLLTTGKDGGLPRSIRRFCSTHNTNQIAMSKPIQLMNSQRIQDKAASSDKSKSQTFVTKLDNGLTIATEDSWGQFATIGVLTKAGSRNELPFISGINHFLEKLAFNTTKKFESREQFTLLLEKHGGIFDCQSSRDTMIHAISVAHEGLECAIDILSEVVLQPIFTEHDLDYARQAIAFELENLDMDPNKEAKVMDLIHTAAFGGNTVGLPRLCPAENISKINDHALYTYLKHQHMPSEMVLAGAGVQHDVLVDLAKRYFTAEPIWSDIKTDGKYRKDISYAQYTGGMERVTADLSDVSLGPTDMPELAHVCVALESCSHKDDDFVAYCVLNALMGGGGSFSAGGPGKGMYTRLYTSVLNRYHWIENATAYNHSYEDTGLFCIYGSAHPTRLGDLTVVLTNEMKLMVGPAPREELARAKRQLQSMLLMNLESHPIIFEDLGRQVLSTGERKSAKFFYDLIEKITVDDITRVANRLLRSPVSVAAYGTLERLHQYDSIQDMLTHKWNGRSKLAN